MQPLRDILRTRGSNRRGGYRGRIIGIGIVAIVGLLFTACETAPPPGSSGGYNLKTASVVGNLGSYRLQLVSSPGIESYRSDLQAVASELNGILGRPAFVVDSQLGSSVSAERGVIKIAVAQSAFGCGSAAKATVTVAWGGPCLSEQRNTRYFWTAGIVTLTDNYPACGRRPVLRHEIGHALGLGHFGESADTPPLFNGEIQTMYGKWNPTGYPCGVAGYRSGDINGIRYLDSNRPIDTAMSPVTYGGSICNDLLARNGTDLWLYPGNCDGGFGAAIKIGFGWSPDYDLLTSADLNNDRCPDVVARRASDARLFSYESDCAGNLAAKKEIGVGWTSSTIDSIFSGDLDSDGCDDLMARNSVDRTLWFYRGNCDRTFRTKVQIGQGWGPDLTGLHTSDTNGDGCLDVVANDASTGKVLSFRGNCSTGLASPVQLNQPSYAGHLEPVLSRELTGDGCADLVGRNYWDGALMLYEGKCDSNSTYKVGRQIGQGWSSSTIDRIF